MIVFLMPFLPGLGPPAALDSSCLPDFTGGQSAVVASLDIQELGQGTWCVFG